MQLFGLSEQVAGRPVRAEGYLAVLPGPGRPAAVLGAGTGAETLGPPVSGLALTAVDFDTGGDAVASRFAKAGAPLRVSVDGWGRRRGAGGRPGPVLHHPGGVPERRAIIN